MDTVATGGFLSGDALFAFDSDLRVVAWNRAAEALTGVPAREAVGRPCWDVLGGSDEHGALVCHAGCSYARLAREGWPVRAHDISIRTANGQRRVTLSTVALRDEGLFLHLMHVPEAEASEAPDDEVALSPRQLQVLELAADGLPAKAIGEQLGISVATVRNHIRAILVELSAHSQLEAVANARRHGLLKR